MAIQNYVISACFIFWGVQGGWIDPDTPQDKRTTVSLIDGTEYKLVSAKRCGGGRMDMFHLKVSDFNHIGYLARFSLC
jgi:hypothetical protein